MCICSTNRILRRPWRIYSKAACATQATHSSTGPVRMPAYNGKFPTIGMPEKRSLMRFDDVDRPQDVIIFMIGGTTYAEARVIAMLNQESAQSGASSAAGTRLLLGGTCIHNSSRYDHTATCSRRFLPI